LAPGRFAAKAAAHEPWIVLDFLGFPRPNRDFQWVTRLEAGKTFSSAFSLALTGAETGARGRGHAEAQDWSWRELSLTSDFLQWIVVRALAFRRPNPKAACSSSSFARPAERQAESYPPNALGSGFQHFCGYLRSLTNYLTS
jgi:hypothetical protein